MAWHPRQLVDLNGVTWGTGYTAESVGDIFPEHTHVNQDLNHVTIFVFGDVEMIGEAHREPDGSQTVYRPEPGGTMKDWPLGQSHGFKALTAGATIFNLTHKRG